MESVDIRALTAEIERRSHLIESLRTGMHQAIVGQSHLIDSLLIGLLSGGHILLEGLPGLAKALAMYLLWRVEQTPEATTETDGMAAPDEAGKADTPAPDDGGAS